jgi:hypothetical protein
MLFRVAEYCSVYRNIQFHFSIIQSSMQSFCYIEPEFWHMLQFPYFFSYNFTETCSGQRKIRFLSFRGMEKGGNTLPPCIHTFPSYDSLMPDCYMLFAPISCYFKKRASHAYSCIFSISSSVKPSSSFSTSFSF